LLIEPITRIPRYVLLFKELLKYTETNHPDYSVVTKALEKVSGVALLHNERKRSADERNAVLRVYQAVLPELKDLITPTRRLLFEGPVTELRAKCKQYLFLFSDLLLITKKENNKYILKHRFQLSELKCVDVSDNKTYAINIEVPTNIYFIFSIESQQTKQEWVDNFIKAKLNLDRDLVQLSYRLIQAQDTTTRNN